MHPPSPSNYTCDTLPVPQNIRLTRNYHTRSPSPPQIEPPLAFDVPTAEEVQAADKPTIPASMPNDDELPQPPARKLCVRHLRMADEGTTAKLQQSLDALPVAEREAASSIWSTFSSSSHPQRALILQGLLTMCCFSQLSLLTEQLAHLIRIDPFTVLPREINLKVLGYLDAISLCRAAQVTHHWRELADDDVLWRNICEQHIGQKCHKCGWGLPMLERRRRIKAPISSSAESSASSKRDLEELTQDDRPIKRQRSESTDAPLRRLSALSVHSATPTPGSSRCITPSHISPPNIITRPWKDVYSERLRIERNWRRGRCSVRTLKGHTDGVMCMQFSETLQHPSFPVLITGSYDRTARVWNLERGEEVQCLRGHSRAVRALQFDEAKLITGSMDHTMRVWNWRTGRCIRTLEGHTEGVVCLNFDSNVLASGSVDTTVKIWNFRTGECFTLRGHRDWVNSVQLWDSNPSAGESGVCCTPMFEPSASATLENSSVPTIDPGKMLFSASDDGTIRLWDLNLRSCVRQFTGHVGQVQSMKLLLVDPECDEDDTSSRPHTPPPEPATPPRPTPVLISGSLDNTIRVWDVETGKALATLFGHIEGVWAVASDKLRLVSGSHDRTIKVWVREEGRCMATLVGHRGAVTCLALGDDKIVSGSDDGDIRIWNFAE
ncbi:WD40 repeat-like protein [Rickenella mellea]|uniref:WD40 repeat-like protein n=1 Tax=Rickenella mellea TaxID=50990 RepID=A0A4Y7QIW9_9AGAM|nr:WD40 repeat-like protein [Rickenella mellea]